jgi:GT2 family glycosyltransferase
MTADVVIVNYNTKADLLRCLASLLNEDPRPSIVARVIVVDNGSSDGSSDAVRGAFPAVEVMALGRNAGFAAANNVAIRAATAPLVLLLNSDTVVTAPALDTLADRLNATGATAAGPRIVDGDGYPEVSFGQMLSPLAEARQQRLVKLASRRDSASQATIAQLLSEEREVDWVTGACVLVRRDAALAAGLLDERYFLYEEDVDFCAALRARGGRILFTPRAQIVHLRGRARAKDPGAARVHYDRSHLAFYEKHLPRWAPVLRAWLKLRGRRIN